MRGLLLSILIAVDIPVVLVFALGAGDCDGGTYKVRAIFDDVASAVEGEDVKISGARVGFIEEMNVTKENKAAVTLVIEDAGFQPFYSDASCTIRPQSLIGEKFVECSPGSTKESELQEIGEGEDGEGEHLLPVENTSSPVDIDLINNIARRPYRERLAIILAELGTGLAGRGSDLNEVIHRANPAFREFDRVLKILGDQNDVLAKLVTDSDRVLEPLARERRHLTHFVETANETAEASAERRDDISGSIERLPAFLSELEPMMADLGDFAEETTPVMRDLGRAAPDFNKFIEQLGPFSEASLPAIESLGDAAVIGRPALIRTEPLLRDLRRFAVDAVPVAKNLDALTASLDKTGGIERVMDYIFFQMTAINGFDGVSHYLRAGLIVNLCSAYAITPTPGCNANFTGTRAITAGAASAGKRDPYLENTRRVLAGKEALPAEQAEPVKDDPKKDTAGSTKPGGTIFKGLLGVDDPELKLQRQQAIDNIRKSANRGHSEQLEGLGGAAEPILEYLLGADR